ncbi:expressed unknown protein [Seminavis robusta]|uniref:Uncharacterized protein n=1 Tax=Seminavis robusta TaxID=568900 RepID=A0A9N8EFT3_9STRA|nr:expressed unknown protein [Seminavis robusta]|eukprot:Sro926_g221070.1 n/a (881) ;mRNA; r:30024-33037
MEPPGDVVRNRNVSTAAAGLEDEDEEGDRSLRLNDLLDHPWVSRPSSIHARSSTTIVENDHEDESEDRPGLEDNSTVDLRQLLSQMESMRREMTKLRQEVADLKRDQRRHSSTTTFDDWINASAILHTSNNNGSDNNSNNNPSRPSVKSLPAELFLTQLRSSLSAGLDVLDPQQQQEQQLQNSSSSTRTWGRLQQGYQESSIHHHHHRERSIPVTSSFSSKRDLVFLHPEEVGERDFTIEELHKIEFRPFPSRIFITNLQLKWITAWLRTRHTDHHDSKSSFNYVRDVIKADAITNNPPGAKYALTELLNMCYEMNESEYYSFACTLASAFSNRGENTEFEKSLLIHPTRLDAIEAELGHKIKSDEEMDILVAEQERSRKRLIQLLDIVFSKLKQKKILVDEKKDNIYRLVHCMTKYTGRRLPYFYTIFSFFFQVCAASYVALSLTDLGGNQEESMILQDWGPSLVTQNIFLAVGTACYGFMVACPEMSSTLQMFRYLHRREFSWLFFLDFIVNFVLPITMAFCGFLVVLRADNFLEGVLNAVALIFITEIDDQLPRLLELDTKDIVQGFLIDQAMEEYKSQDRDKEIPAIEFSDMIITNTAESGSIPTSGITFQPYEVFDGDDGEREVSVDSPSTPFCPSGAMSRSSTSERRRRSSMFSASQVEQRGRSSLLSSPRGGERRTGQQVANKRQVSAHCLLRKIEWQYTGDKEGLFAGSTRPRIGRLILHKLRGGDPIRILGKQRAPPEARKEWYTITGVYIITSFSMSDDVTRLRICGSQSTESFMEAFRYYNLWPLESSAKELLKKTAGFVLSETDEMKNDRVLHGKPRPRKESPASIPVPKQISTFKDQVVDSATDSAEEEEIYVAPTLKRSATMTGQP